MSIYDQELTQALEENNVDCTILGSSTAELFFDALNERFPIYGTQIKWSDVGVFHKRLDNSLDKDEFMDCITAIKEQYFPDFEHSIVVYLGDSLTEMAYRLPLKNINAFFSIAIQIPQHHYFVDHKVRWCIALNMTGDFDFGYSSVNDGGIKVE